MVGWVIIFLAGAALTIWNVFVVFEDYFKYQVDTSISVNKNTVVGEFRLFILFSSIEFNFGLMNMYLKHQNLYLAQNPSRNDLQPKPNQLQELDD